LEQQDAWEQTERGFALHFHGKDTTVRIPLTTGLWTINISRHCLFVAHAIQDGGHT